ncbi:MAG: glycosyltransferase family 2 protein [Patescibacteria group bacterium]|nr:glycosyltransferase family 2 protein [Patescibacteria group bacterium]
MNDQIDVSIVIVSWRVKRLLRQCLASIYHETKSINFEVFVVDNASSDGTEEMVKGEFPEVKLIVNKENLGFAKANNQALSLARGDFLLVLNPDTEIINNAVEKTVKFMRQTSTAGVTGCRLLNPDKTSQPSVRGFPTLSAISLLMLKLHRVLTNLPTFKKYFGKSIDYNKTQEVDQVMGAFFMIRRELVRKIGIFDEKFFIWFEEVDYCYRAKLAGWRVYYFAGAEIIHHYGQSFNQLLNVRKQTWLNRSALRYFRKHHSIFAYLLLLLIYPFSILISLLVQILKLK